jgi:hypothetical protein
MATTNKTCTGSPPSKPLEPPRQPQEADVQRQRDGKHDDVLHVASLGDGRPWHR